MIDRRARSLLLLPGLDGTEVLFRPLIRSAPQGIEVSAVTYPRGPANRYEDLLPRVRESLPQDRPFYLLGWSFSGPLALMAAAEHPPHLKGVILVSSFASRPVRFVPRWARHVVRPILFRAFPTASSLKARLTEDGHPEVLPLLREAHSQAGHEALACRARAALGVDASSALAACPAPVLYLRATADRVIRTGCAEDVQRQLPGAAMADLTGSHLALASNPGEAWSALLAFMDRVEEGNIHGPVRV